MWIWAGIVLAASSWSFVAGVVPAEPLLQWGFVAAALVCFVRGRHAVACPRHVGSASAGLLAAVVACAWCLFVSPAEYRPGFWLLGAGLIGGVLRSPRARVAAGSARHLGLLLVVQAAALWGFEAWSARNPELPYLAQLLHPMLRWLGFEAGESDGTLFLNTLKYNHAFALTWNHLGASHFLFIGIGALGVVLPTQARSRWPAVASRILAILVAFAVVRFVVILGVYLSRMLFVPYDSSTVHVQLFWLPWVLVLTCLPLIPLLGRCFPVTVVAAEPLQVWRARLPAVSLAAVAGLGLAAWLWFPDPGVQKPGRVLIDESRGPWERSDVVYGPDWYGVESGYNYACLTRYLRHYYEVSHHKAGGLTYGVLDSCDVLVLKTPNRDYSVAELEAIETFVRKGGGLFVLGEHTNVWGSSVYLNRVLEPYGMAFRYDCVFDLDRRWEQLYQPGEWGRHPVVADVPFFLFAVSCSLDIRSHAVRSVARGRRLWTLPIDYTPSNFYPEVRDRSDAFFGSFDQIAVASHGRGRVVAFTDSTTFSNFDLFDPGKSELLLGSVDWLNRTNRLGYVRWIGLGLIALCGLALVAMLCWTPVAAFLLPVVLTGSAALFVGAAACDALGKVWYPGPTEKTPVSRLRFDLEHCSYEIPIFGFPQDYQNCYEVFYMWTQRLGCAPRISFDLSDAFRRRDPVVLIHPDRAFTPGEIDRARSFLERGGRLLVLDSPGNPRSSAQALLELGGLSFAERASSEVLMNPLDSAALCNVGGGNHYWKPRGVLTVEGGEPLLFTTKGETVAAFSRVGDGMILAVGFADAFANPGMGGSHSEVPDAEHRTKFEVEFTLIRSVLSGDPHAERNRLEATFVSKD